MKTITLTSDQEKANNAFLDFLIGPDNYLVIKGAAGTGKSFLIRHLLETFFAKYQSYCLLLQQDVKEFEIKVTATTNKAVSVVDDFLLGINDSQHPITTSTIFSLLNMKIKNNRNVSTMFRMLPV